MSKHRGRRRLDGQKDVANILRLMHDLGGSPPAELNSRAERWAWVSKMIKEAQEIRKEVGEILCWIVNPNENAERDSRAVKLISEHSHGVKLQFVNGRVVGRSFEGEHLLDLISRFMCGSLRQVSEDLALLPEPCPIRRCKAQQCPKFFVRDGKNLYCKKHRRVKTSRSTGQNTRYKYVRDHMRTSLRKLEKNITSGRLAIARDGAWKQECLRQIHIDRSKGIKKRPIDYLRAD